MRANNFNAPVAIAIVLTINIAVLNWVGVGLAALFGSYLVQLVWTLAGAWLISRYRRIFDDTILFWLTAWFVGLIVYFTIGFVTFHRAVLGTTPHVATLAATALIGVLAAFQLWSMVFRKSNRRMGIGLPATAMMLSVAFVVAAMGAYGYGNNTKKIRVQDENWSFSAGPTPEWSYQSDRLVHVEQITPTIFADGFPPERVGHRGHHVIVVMLADLTAAVDRQGLINAYKTLSLTIFFTIAYGLCCFSRYILALPLSTSVLVGCTSLIFSPLKLPLFELSPTYRGFFSASGTLYHSDTQNSSVACAVLAIVFLARSFQKNAPGFLIGAVLLAGSFFLKPSNFMMIAPVLFVLTFINWPALDRERVLGLLVLAAIPVLWFGYLHLSSSSSTLDDILSLQQSSEENLGLSLKFFEGYLPRLDGRFPAFIDGNPALMVLAMIALSFAAFWPGAGVAATSVYRSMSGFSTTINHLRTHAHIYLPLGSFALAIIISITLGEAFSKNVNWKWAAAAGYILCLPAFVKGITLVSANWLRSGVWMLYLVQSAQGIGYLWYLFFNSNLD